MNIHDLADAPIGLAMGTSKVWRTTGSQMGNTADNLRAISAFPGWTGKAAEGMSQRVAAIAGRTNDASDAADTIGILLGLHTTALAVFQGTVVLTIGLATTAGMTVHSDGTVTPKHSGIGGAVWTVGETLIPAVKAGREGAAVALTAVLHMAMLKVQEIDAMLAKIVAAAAAVDFAPMATMGAIDTPTPNGSASALSPSGAPPVVVVEDIIDAIHIDPVLYEQISSKTLSDATNYAIGAARELQLRGLDPTEIGIHLTQVNGALSVIVGDIDTADKVTTLVSGTGSSDPTRLGDSSALAGRITGPGQATIAWHGYSAPKDLASAASPTLARVGAPSLQLLQRSLRDRNPNAHLSIVGHSYGTAVIDSAGSSPTPLEADEIHLMASPGMTSGSASALNLHARDGHAEVHVHRNVGDPITLAAKIPWILGNDPSTPQFGADSVNGRDPKDNGGVLGSWYDGLTDLRRTIDGDLRAHSNYRGDEKVLEALRH